MTHVRLQHTSASQGPQCIHLVQLYLFPLQPFLLLVITISTYSRWHHQAERTCKGTCFYTPLIATSATSLAKLLLQASVHASNMLPNERQQHITSSTRLVEPRRSWGCMPDSLSGFPVLYLTQIQECNTFFSTQWPCFLVFELSPILCSICGPGMSDLLLLTELTNALDLLSAITRPLEVAMGRFNLSVLKTKSACKQLPTFHVNWRFAVTEIISDGSH